MKALRCAKLLFVAIVGVLLVACYPVSTLDRTPVLTATQVISIETPTKTATSTGTPTVSVTPMPTVDLRLLTLKFEVPADSSLTKTGYIYKVLEDTLGWDFWRLTFENPEIRASAIVLYDTRTSEYINTYSVDVTTVPAELENAFGTLLITVGGPADYMYSWKAEYGEAWEKVTYCVSITRESLPESVYGAGFDDPNGIKFDFLQNRYGKTLRDAGCGDVTMPLYMLPLSEADYLKLKALAGK